MSTIPEKYWAESESRRGDGQSDVENTYQQLYRRPYMMVKSLAKNNCEI